MTKETFKHSTTPEHTRAFEHGYDSPADHDHEDRQTEYDHNSKEKTPQEQQETLDDAKALAEKADEQRKEIENQKSPAEKRLSGAPSKKRRQAVYKETLDEIRSEMNPGEKIVSSIIHNPVIEPVSDFVGATIARPNALLSGSIAAFVVVTCVYFAAKHYGYQLSGSETITAFVIGWLLGIVYDYLSSLFRHEKHK